MTYKVTVKFNVKVNADNKKDAISNAFDIIQKSPNSIGYKIEVSE